MLHHPTVPSLVDKAARSSNVDARLSNSTQQLDSTPFSGTEPWPSHLEVLIFIKVLSKAKIMLAFSPSLDKVVTKEQNNVSKSRSSVPLPAWCLTAKRTHHYSGMKPTIFSPGDVNRFWVLVKATVPLKTSTSRDKRNNLTREQASFPPIRRGRAPTEVRVNIRFMFAPSDTAESAFVCLLHL